MLYIILIRCYLFYDSSVGRQYLGRAAQSPTMKTQAAFIQLYEQDVN